MRREVGSRSSGMETSWRDTVVDGETCASFMVGGCLVCDGGGEGERSARRFIGACVGVLDKGEDGGSMADLEGKVRP